MLKIVSGEPFQVSRYKKKLQAKYECFFHVPEAAEITCSGLFGNRHVLVVSDPLPDKQWIKAVIQCSNDIVLFTLSEVKLKIKKGLEIKTFPMPQDEILRKWIAAAMAPQRITQEAADLILSRTDHEEDLFSVFSEIEKLSSLGIDITAHEVERYIPVNRTARIFSLTDLILNGDSNTAYAEVELLLSDPDWNVLSTIALIEQKLRVYYKYAVYPHPKEIGIRYTPKCTHNKCLLTKMLECLAEARCAYLTGSMNECVTIQLVFSQLLYISKKFREEA